MRSDEHTGVRKIFDTGVAKKLDNYLFLAAAPPGIAVLTSSSTMPWRYAPEQGTRPDTAHRSFKLRLPDRRTAPVSTAIKLPRNETKR